MSVKTVYCETVYHRLLAEFPDLTRPPAFGRKKIRHAVVHHIETTPGPPVSCKLLRLAPDRLMQVKAEFATMIEQRVMRPSKSPWASPLHVVSKKDGNLRPCGDYRDICVERPRCARQVFPPHIEDFAQHLHGKRFFFFKNRSHPRLPSNPDRARRRQENRDHDTLRTFRSNQHYVWASKRRANVSKVCR